MAEQTTSSITIDATPADVMAVIADFEAYPAWAKGVTTADVRAVRTFVQRGEAALGIVYRSDAIGAAGVRIVVEPPEAEQPTIVYPVAATRGAAGNAQSFLAFLTGPEARRIFIAHGFRTRS